MFLKAIEKILQSAINDWPTQIVNLEDYEKEVYKLIGEDIDKKKLENFISNIDVAKDAWVAESLSELVELYKFYDEKKSLKEIFHTLSEYKIFLKK